MSDLAALREALNGVVTKTTWRPDGTMLLHDAEAWTTLVGRIVMLTNGDYRAVALRSEDAAPLDEMEAEAGRLLVESARVRAARLGPDDAHELRHLWAAINAGNSDPCGVNGESCHLDVEAIRRWTEQYPKVVGAALAEPDR